MEGEVVPGEELIPVEFRKLRACLFCGLVKNDSQFKENGCENCPFLHLKGDNERIERCTSNSFEGMIAMMNPEDSWVSKWQRFPPRSKPGCYAMVVNGRLPSDIVQNLERNGIRYVPRTA
eukprot:TRINITY_DN1483_c0_g1_i1.p1 TRINITY_DN1483_c0_g1~~TRINITY_DN1483_c0_g1_i1.p1  ORF type:complete len:120 (-),score=13.48 TRINITY_DN1483_c0_g1_i1:245-604(-)